MTVCGQLASFVQTSVSHSEERPFQSFSLEGLALSRVAPDSEGFGLQVFDTLPQGGRGWGQTEHKGKVTAQLEANIQSLTDARGFCTGFSQQTENREASPAPGTQGSSSTKPHKAPVSNQSAADVHSPHRQEQKIKTVKSARLSSAGCFST